MGDLLDFRTRVLYGHSTLSEGQDSREEAVGPEQAWPCLQVPQSTAVPASDWPSPPHPAPPLRSHLKKGERGERALERRLTHSHRDHCLPGLHTAPWSLKERTRGERS